MGGLVHCGNDRWMVNMPGQASNQRNTHWPEDQAIAPPCLEHAFCDLESQTRLDLEKDQCGLVNLTAVSRHVRHAEIGV